MPKRRWTAGAGQWASFRPAQQLAVWLLLRANSPAEDSSRARLFHVLPSTGPGGAFDAYAILLRLLHRNDWFTQEKACLLLTAVLASRPNKAALVAPPAGGAANGASTSATAAPALPGGVVSAADAASADEVQKAASAFIDWLCAQLRRPSDPARSVPTAVHALSQLLREPPMRAMLHRAGGVQLLAPLVAMPPPGTGQLNIQLLYEAALCCWELSFYRPAADVLCGSTNVVGALVDMVRLAQVRAPQRWAAARCSPAFLWCMPGMPSRARGCVPLCAVCRRRQVRARRCPHRHPRCVLPMPRPPSRKRSWCAWRCWR